jgi:hypothetical protein
MQWRYIKNPNDKAQRPNEIQNPNVKERGK